MSATNFRDRREAFFGREQDVEYLLGRVVSPGLTAIVGRPKLGKTWLLEEVGRRTQEDSIVGYHESTGQTSDILLRVISDAYVRWLSFAGFIDQARSLRERHRDDLVGRAGSAVGAILEAVGKITKGPTKPLATIVGRALNSLTQADTDLKTAGLRLEPLQYEQARDLVVLLGRLSGKKAVLIWDAWEQSPSVELEHKLLSRFLDRVDEWGARCHFLIGLRPDDPACHLVADLERQSPAAKMYELGLMNLDDIEERKRMLSWVRTNVPATRTLDDGFLVSQVSGFPGVLHRWSAESGWRELGSREDLIEEAKNAQEYRYRELGVILTNRELSVEARTLALRLILLPRLSEEQWLSLKPRILQELPATALDELHLSKLLLPETWPSLGHETRHEAALRFVGRDVSLRALLFREADLLIHNFAEGAQRVTDDDFLLLVVSLVAISTRVTRSTGLPLSAGAVLLTTCCRILLEGKEVPPPLSSSLTANLGSLGRDSIPNCPLLGMAIVNVLAGLTDNGLIQERQHLMDELRALQQSNPDDAQVLASLVAGLYNALIDAREVEDDLDRQDSLLDELRLLQRSNPDDAQVWEPFAKGLVNALGSSIQEKDLECRLSLLDELRALHRLHLDDAEGRAQFAAGLFNTLTYAAQQEALDQRDSLLDELRVLQRSSSGNAQVRGSLAKGLVNTLYDARQAEDLEGLGALLDELRALQRLDPGGAHLRAQLAMGIVNAISYAKLENDLDPTALLDELRALQQSNPDDAQVRGQLAMGLFNTLYYVRQEEDLDRRDLLLDELRALQRLDPDSVHLRAQLARGLTNTLGDANQEDPDRRLSLLDELRALQQLNPDDAQMREYLAVGVVSSLYYAKQEEDLDRRDSLLHELRALQQSNLDDDRVRAQLAMGLFNTLIDAEQEEDLERRDSLLSELRVLQQLNPDDAKVREIVSSAEQRNRERGGVN